MHLPHLKAQGRAVLVTGFAQFPLCVLLGVGAFVALGHPLAAAGRHDALYLAIACALSSTAVVVKLLADRFSLDTRAGRITVGVLVVQDVFAILVLAFQPNLGDPSVLPVVKIEGKTIGRGTPGEFARRSEQAEQSPQSIPLDGRSAPMFTRRTATLDYSVGAAARATVEYSRTLPRLRRTRGRPRRPYAKETRMKRSHWVLASIVFAAALAAPPLPAPAQQSAAQPAKHRVVFQVSDKDPAKWNLTLNNIRNVRDALGKDKVDAEVVAYGPGLAMLKMDSEVGGRVAARDLDELGDFHVQILSTGFQKL